MQNNGLPIESILSGNVKSLYSSLQRLASPANNHSGERDSAILPLTQPPFIEPSQLLQAIQQPLALANGLLLKQLLHAHFVHPSLKPSLIQNQIFVDQTLSTLWQVALPVPAIQEASKRLTLALIIRLLPSPDILILEEHPLRACIETLFSIFSVWDGDTPQDPPDQEINTGTNASKETQQFIQTVEQLIASVSNIDIRSSQACQQLHEQLLSLQRRNHARVQKLEHRLIDTLQNTSSIEHTQTDVLYEVHKRLSGKPLPSDIIAFMERLIIPDLQYLAIHQGISSPQWRQWQRLLQVLSWAFCDDQGSAQKSRVKNLLPPFMERLGDNEWQPIRPENSGQYQKFFHQLQSHCIGILTNHFPKCDLFTVEISGNNKPLNRTEPVVDLDQSVISKLDKLEAGQWFVVLGTAGHYQKGKILYLSSQQNIILLVRHNGKKLAQYRYQEFALGLASNIIKPITTQNLLHKALLSTVKVLDKQYQRQCLQQAEQLQKLKKQQEAQRLSAEKAQREAEALQKSQLQASVTLSDQQQAALSARITQLNVGAWLEQQTPSGAQQIKLAVKLSASDKYIFSDRLGRKVGQYTLQQLVTMLSNNHIKILSQGQEFENSLEKVVKGLRKNRPIAPE